MAWLILALAVTGGLLWWIRATPRSGARAAHAAGSARLALDHGPHGGPVHSDPRGGQSPETARVLADVSRRIDPSAGIEVEEMDESFFGEVAALLERQLETHPGRGDLYMTLLELYQASGRKTPFLKTARRFATIAEPAQWTQVMGMAHGIGADLSPIHPARSAHRGGARRLRVRDRFEAEDFAEPQVAEALPEPDTSPAMRHYEHWSRDAVALERRLGQVRATYRQLRRDAAFLTAHADLVSTELERPSPFHFAEGLTKHAGGARIYLKREDLHPPESERMFNALGQALVARFAGQRRLICGSLLGRSARAYATASRALGLELSLFVPSSASWAEGLSQDGHVEVVTVDDGNGGVRDPREQALARWIADGEDAMYVSGLKAGPDPYPTMVADFQAIAGLEVMRQLIRAGHGPPRAVVCGAEGNLSSLGSCQPFLDRDPVDLAMVLPTGGMPNWSREQRWLAATRRVQFPEISDASAAEARSLCREREEVSLTNHNARALAHAIQYASLAAEDDAVVVVLTPLTEAATAACLRAPDAPARSAHTTWR